MPESSGGRGASSGPGINFFPSKSQSSNLTEASSAVALQNLKHNQSSGGLHRENTADASSSSLFSKSQQQQYKLQKLINVSSERAKLPEKGNYKTPTKSRLKVIHAADQMLLGPKNPNSSYSTGANSARRKSKGRTEEYERRQSQRSSSLRNLKHGKGSTGTANQCQLPANDTLATDRRCTNAFDSHYLRRGP